MASTVTSSALTTVSECPAPFTVPAKVMEPAVRSSSASLFNVISVFRLVGPLKEMSLSSLR